MSMGLPLGLALASGLNTYLPLFGLTLFARFSGMVHVDPRFQWLISDEAIVVLGVLCVAEILADKFPVVDHAWDFVHTLLRPVAGALAAGATVNADDLPRLVLTMLTGATLATAAHSAKSSVRLMSTSKTAGIANPLLSLGEDVVAAGGTVLSVYAPWLMLGIVVIFAVVFALVGPWLLRTLWFNLHILGSWLKYLLRGLLGTPDPRELRESLLALPPGRLQSLGANLQTGEELVGALSGWKRARGPRPCWLLLTSQRLLVVQPRLFRKPKILATLLGDVVAVRERNFGPFVRLDVLTRRHESLTIHLPKTQGQFGAMVANRMREFSDIAALTSAAAVASVVSGS
ncbi:MAG: DUF4126 domain-containing protein [Terriglobia bacterium]